MSQLVMTRVALSAVLLCCLPGVAAAHPVPFSYIDAKVEPAGLELTVVAHVFDIANDLRLQPPERLLDAATLAAQGGAIGRLVGSRIGIEVDGGSPGPAVWSAPG